jgi:ubiquinol-cytochrome c reductase cytochrome b subunit
MLLVPFYLRDRENFKEADLLASPIHIQPEWYFLYAYAILRAVPNKVGGVMLLFIRVIMFFLLGFYPKRKQANHLKVISFIVSFLVVVVVVLSWVGRCSVEAPYLVLSQVFTVLYFV